MTASPDSAGTLTLFGGFGLSDAGGAPVSVQRGRVKDLLTVLAVAPGQTASREWLVELFWPHLDPARARHNLRQTALVTSRVLASADLPVLGGRDGHIVFPSGLMSDVKAFQTHAGARDPDTLQQAAACYTGPIRGDLQLGDDPFSEWLQTTRAAFERDAVNVFERLIERLSAEQPSAAVDLGKRLLAIEPYREDVHRKIMSLYVQLGQRASALAQYRTCRELLNRELDVEPEAETQDLYRQISANEAAPDTAPVASDGPAGQTEEILGRTAEVKAVDRAVRGLSDGISSTLVFRGEPGMGKTHLLAFAETRARSTGTALLRAQGRSFERTVPYALVDQLVGGRARPQGGEKDDEGGRAGASTSGQADDDLMRAIRIRAGSRPLVVLVDDAQYGDPASLAVLITLAGRGDIPVALMMGCAADGVGAASATSVVAAAPGARVYDLSPLNRQQTADLALTLAPQGRARIRNRVGRVHLLSGGNPGAIHQIIADYLAGPMDRALAVPALVRADLGERLAAVSPEAGRLARTAAMAGNDTDWQVVAAAADLAQRADLVADLASVGVIEGTSETVRFTRPRLAVALREDLSPPVARAISARLAEALAPAIAAGTSRQYAQLAGFYDDAGDRSAAGRTMLDAARFEFDRCSLGLAERHAAQAVQWLKQLPAGGPCHEEVLARAHLLVAEIAFERDKGAETRDALAKATFHAQEARLDGLQARVYELAARLAASLADVATAEQYLRYGADLTESAFQKGEAPSPVSYWGAVDLWFARLDAIDDLDRERARLEAAAGASQRQERRRDEVAQLTKLAAILKLTGAVAEGDAVFQKARGLIERHGVSGALAVLEMLRGFSDVVVGRDEAGIDALVEARGLAARQGDWLCAASAAVLHGGALRYAGRPDAAVEVLADVRIRLQAIGRSPFDALVAAWTADSLAERADTAAADEAAAARDQALGANATWAYAVALRAEARLAIAAGGGSLRAAEELLDESLALSDGARLFFESALTRQVLARVQRRRGDVKGAARSYAQCAETFARLGATTRSDQAKRQAEALEA